MMLLGYFFFPIFLFFADMKTHMLTHSKTRPYLCKICGSSYKTPVRLKVHQNVHKERMYECPVCKHSFLANQTLRTHVTRRHPEYKLPPPGTIMNKKSLEKIMRLAEHLKLKVSEGSLSLPQLCETVGIDSYSVKSMLRTTVY